MAVDSTVLIEPEGPIIAAMFPADTAQGLSTRVAGYVATAAAMPPIAALQDATQRDSATIAYALYLAYSAVVARMAAEPMKMTVQDQGSREFVMQQMREWQRLRDQAFADYQTFVAVPEISEGASRNSAATTTTIHW